MTKLEQKSSTINIDKIFDEGREPTEEEWKIWAEEFKPIRKSRRTGVVDLQRTKRTARQTLIDKDVKKRAYAKKENYKSWGEKYNQKRKYLYKYNKEWRENLQATQQLYMFGIDTKKYDSWRGLYRRKYKYNLAEHSYTYKIADNVYVHGFSEKLLQDIGPFSTQTYKKLKEFNIYPEPHYEGYRFKENKVSKTTEKFYLLTEAAAFLDIFMINNRKIGLLNTDEKKLFLKKKLWEAMLQAREDFENE